MALFHRDVFLPRRVKGMVPTGKKFLAYTFHAGQALSQDNIYHPPGEVNLATVEVVEVSVHENIIDKLVIRTECKEKPDYNLCMAIIPTTEKKLWRVKTAWLNHKLDNHNTLNVGIYVSGK